MKIKKITLLMLFVVLLSFCISAYYYPIMPSKMISHWNAQGQPDGYMSRCWALYLMPLISSGMFLLYLIIPKIDPLKKNIEKFRSYYDWLMFLIILFLFYIYLLTILANLNIAFNMTKMMLPALGILFIYIGFLLQHAKRNWFIGIKTPWTLSSDKVWNKTHKLGGWLFKIAGLIAFFGAFSGAYAIWVVLTPIILAALIPIVYSYFEYEKLKH